MRWKNNLINYREQQVLMLLMDEHYVSATAIAKQLNLSDKTIRKEIKNLNLLLVQQGAKIVAKARYGFKLEIHDEQLFQTLKDAIVSGEHEMPEVELRRQQLFDILLHTKKYYKIDDLCEMFYSSRKTVSKDIKQVEKELANYGLQLLRKPNYGIKIDGSEFQKRLCIRAQYLKYNTLYNVLEKALPNLEKVSMCVLDIMAHQNYTISDMALQNLIVHLQTGIVRIKNECYITSSEIEVTSYNLQEEYAIATLLCEQLGQMFDVTFPEAEKQYIAIHLAGKKQIQKLVDANDNLVISKEIDDLTSLLLERVHENFGFDFRNNLDLKMALAKHLLPLKLRLAFGMNMKNPLLEEIKNRYLFPYTMSEFVGVLVAEHFGKPISDDEIGYFALHFALALEQGKEVITKKRILVVCASGYGSSQLLLYKYKEQFHDYIEHIEACSVNDLAKLDLHQFDYIFSTTPILIKVSKPVIEVGYFLDKGEVKKIAKTMLKKNYQIHKYYAQDLFISNLDAKDKADAIHQMCQVILAHKALPASFEEAVLKREEITQTEYGNEVAITHPLEPVGKDTFACVALLKHPILWQHKMVRSIFLISIEKAKHKKIQDFYKITSALLVDGERMKTLHEQPTYETLLELLTTIENEVIM